MIRIAVLGANGQVGAEVCLLLARNPKVEVVPICRNPTGSAFLRFQGIRCRHGLPADPEQAPRLLGDCGVVLNFARSMARPREASETNQRIIENAARFSCPGAKILYFSTLQVYRSFRPVGASAWRTAYGAEKLGCEKMARRAAARCGKENYVLRLGHVCGELQNITADLRKLIGKGSVVVPLGGEHPSNTVYTVNILDAVLKIAAGAERPGTYDLLCSPPMTWRQVLELEAASIGRDLRIEIPLVDPLANGARARGSSRLTSHARQAMARVLTMPLAREMGLRLLEHLPEGSNARAQSAHFRRRALAEIGQLLSKECTFGAFTYAAAGGRFLTSLEKTTDLLKREATPLSANTLPTVLAPDLPYHEPGPTGGA